MSNKPTAAQTSNSSPSQANIAKAWDAVYGPGFYTAHVLGANIHIHGVLNGEKGTVLDVDAFRNPGTGDDAMNSRKGIAFDTNSNIYKLVF